MTPSSSASRIRLEICVTSVNGVRTALEAGADRVELCADLPSGGTTPSLGAVARAREIAGPGTLMVLVRPRPGDFVYDELEASVMLEDVRRFRDLGVDGVVVGGLTPEGAIDEPLLERVRTAAQPLAITFHRAFDHVRDPFASLEVLRRHAVPRVLTSGQAATATEGADRIARLVELAAGHPIILAGGGLKEASLGAFVARTRVTEVHVSAGILIESRASFRNPSCDVGSSGPRPNSTQQVATDAARIRRYIEALGGAPTLPVRDRAP